MITIIFFIAVLPVPGAITVISEIFPRYDDLTRYFIYELKFHAPDGQLFWFMPYLNFKHLS